MDRFYFDSIRLKMGMGGRFLARLFIYAFYGSLAASSIVLSFAELRWMQSLGIFIILFLIDRLMHINQADKKLAELPPGRVNLNEYLLPTTNNVVEKASERCYFLGGHFDLWLIKQCLEQVEIKKGLKRLEVDVKVAVKKIDQLIKSDGQIKIKKSQIEEMLDRVVKEAGERALERGGSYVEPQDLFTVLAKSRSELVRDFYKSLDIKFEDLEKDLIFG
jgi:hypothetical protein